MMKRFRAWLHRQENGFNTWLQERGIIKEPLWLMWRKWRAPPKVVDLRPARRDPYAGILLIGGHFAYHDIEFERSMGVSDETLGRMKKQNATTEKAYLADAKRRNVEPVRGW